MWNFGRHLYKCTPAAAALCESSEYVAWNWFAATTALRVSSSVITSLAPSVVRMYSARPQQAKARHSASVLGLGGPSLGGRRVSPFELALVGSIVIVGCSVTASCLRLKFSRIEAGRSSRASARPASGPHAFSGPSLASGSRSTADATLASGPPPSSAMSTADATLASGPPPSSAMSTADATLASGPPPPTTTRCSSASDSQKYINSLIKAALPTISG